MIGDTWTAVVLDHVNRTLNYKLAAPSLVSISINVDLGNSHVANLCKGLRHCNKINSVVLSKLSCQPDGYANIAALLRSVLHLSGS